MHKRVAVYCGASPDSNPLFCSMAFGFGYLLAQNSGNLVYGGGNTGLMGAVANGTIAGGGYVNGVITSRLTQVEGAYNSPRASIIEVGTMAERKAIMESMAHAYAILPGGFGTLDGAFQVITDKAIGIHAKPIVFVNWLGYYDELFASLRVMRRNGMVSNANLFTVCEGTPQAVQELIA